MSNVPFVPSGTLFHPERERPVVRESFVRGPRVGADPRLRFGLSVLASCGRKVRSVCRLQTAELWSASSRRLLPGNPAPSSGPLSNSIRAQSEAGCLALNVQPPRDGTRQPRAVAACCYRSRSWWVGAMNRDPNWAGANPGTRTNNSGATGRECLMGSKCPNNKAVKELAPLRLLRT